MFCVHFHENPTNHRLLRSFRSHKSLKLEAARCANDDDMHHHRHTSEASSMARSSTESSRKSDLSVDWDPLRLHPPLAMAPAPVLPESLLQQDSGRRYQPHELRSARSLHSLNSAQSLSPTYQPRHFSSSTTSSSTVIYGGFDFGFPQATQATAPPRAVSPAPSTASTASSSASDSSFATPLTPRPHPARYNEADHYLKRGGWKRRGIVFVSEVQLAGEDESFEI